MGAAAKNSLMVLALSVLGIVFGQGQETAGFSMDTSALSFQSVSNINFMPSRDGTSQLFKKLQLGSSVPESIASLYSELEDVPFGPTIDLSFAINGENFHFTDMKLMDHVKPAALTFVGEESETSTRIPVTTYTTSYLDSDNAACTVIASISALENSYFVNVMCEGKPIVFLQPTELLSLGKHHSDKLASVTSSHVSFTMDNLNSVLGEDFCGSLEVEEVDEISDPLIIRDENDDLVKRSLKTLVRQENCSGVPETLAANTGVVIDYSAYDYFKKSLPNYKLYLQSIYATASLVYYAQFNIRWSIQEIRMETVDSKTGKPWNASPGECPDMTAQLKAFRDWGQPLSEISSKYAFWQLYTICNTSDSGTLGVAYVKAMCGYSKYSVNKTYPASGLYVVTHEIGHNFGSRHAWDETNQNKMGIVGGIMDYNTDGYLLSNHPKTPRAFAFHESSFSPICNYLKGVVKPQNIGDGKKCFTVMGNDTTSAVCGNGIIEHGEECEVATNNQPGSVASCCKQCKLVTGATCSTSSSCCNNCQAQPGACTFSSGAGVCGLGRNIECAHYTPAKNCETGMIFDECKARCGNTYWTLKEGSMCRNKITNALGECISGVCAPHSYEWDFVTGPQCNCEAGVDNTGVVRPHTLLCKSVARENIVSASLCEDLEKPSLKMMDCKHYCETASAGTISWISVIALSAVALISFYF